MIKLVSLNTKRDTHNGKILSFIKRENPDVVCFQEISESQVRNYEKSLGMDGCFKPMFYDLENGVKKIYGVAILSKYQGGFFSRYVVGKEEEAPEAKRIKNSDVKADHFNVVLLWHEFEFSGKKYKIATTHFTLTPSGSSTDYQKRDAGRMIEILDSELGGFIFSGDLNAPRGRETFSMFAQKYKDNIPVVYDSSIDPRLHACSGLVRMVDGLFSTPEYVVEDVKLIEGVSDHKAVVARVH